MPLADYNSPFPLVPAPTMYYCYSNSSNRVAICCSDQNRAGWFWLQQSSTGAPVRWVRETLFQPPSAKVQVLNKEHQAFSNNITHNSSPTLLANTGYLSRQGNLSSTNTSLFLPNKYTFREYNPYQLYSGLLKQFQSNQGCSARQLRGARKQQTPSYPCLTSLVSITLNTFI